MRLRLSGVLSAVMFGVLSLWATTGLAQDVGSGFSNLPPACGTQTISIARMQWPSAILLAHIHAQILQTRFNCKVQIVAGDLAATASSMATTGQPAVAPELWVSRIADLWNSALEADTIRTAGASFSGAPLEGWFVPDFVIENHPGLTGVDVLADYWQVFRPEGATRAQFVSCPPDWACAIINRNMLKALGFDTRFDIIEPANRFELDTLIGEAVSKHLPLLFYYWQPNAVLEQLAFTQLDLGAYAPEALACLARRDCVNPQVSSFAPEPVVIAVAEWVFEQAPQVAGYFQRAQMPVVEMNALLAWQREQAGTPEATAEHFIETRGEVWRSWLGLF